VGELALTLWMVAGSIKLLAGKSEETQISTLIYSMGYQSEDILKSFALSSQKICSGYQKVQQLFWKALQHYI